MKKQKFTLFVGIDISKKTFDVAIINGTTLSHDSFVFENTTKGTKAMINLLKNRKINIHETFFCMEHTGVYGKLIIARLLEIQAFFCVEMALKIMRATVVSRGKNDKLDAIRIAKYALKNHRELDLYKPSSLIVKKVRALLSLRNQLLRFSIEIQRQPNELKHFDPELLKTTLKPVNKILKFINSQIEETEQQIIELVAGDEKLNQHIQLATSVPGIGKFTALYIACFTDLFSKYNTPKQLACYCGVVPFEYSSGTSVRKRPRVHHMANKILKTHLHMGALSAVRFDPELKMYYLRKIEEGKNPMLVLNNVRNKMIHRLCAVLKRGKPFIKKKIEINLV